MPYVIVSAKKNIRALSDENDSVEFHNKLFDTDDCVITWEDPPTKEEIKAMEEIEDAKPKKKKTTIEELEKRVEALEKENLT